MSNGTCDPSDVDAASGAAMFDDPRVFQALEQYRLALETGKSLDRSEFLERYPQIAGALSDCLIALEFVHAVAPSLDQAGQARAINAARMDQATGTLGDFLIVREIGRGGMGIVYEAEQISLGRRVALKVLPFAAALDAKQLLRFKNEAHAAAQLHHTNIVPVFGIGTERGVHYYAMQYIEGQTLAQVVAALKSATCPAVTPLGSERSNRSPSFVQTVARLGIQAAVALEHAHQLGIIHRDIKPGNLMVESLPLAVDIALPTESHSPRLWITDFGLAHCQNQAGLTMTGDLVGTLRYMSPEQALAKRVPVDHRTDVYSLGATLYELLTLEPPFAGADRQELLRQIAFTEPRPPRSLNSAIPRELDTIVLKALEKNPAERYASAQELADDLDRYLENKPIRARRPTVWQRTKKLARRHPGVAWMAVGLLAVVAVGSAVSAGLILHQLHRAEEATLEAGRRRLEAQEERARAVASLYHSLVREAQTLRFARVNGYRRQAWQLLQQASQLNTPDVNREQLKHEAIACLGDFVGLDPTIIQYAGREVTTGALNPAGNRLAVGLRDGTILVRDLVTAQEQVLGGKHRSALDGLVFTPDGNRLISQDNEGTIRLWESGADASWRAVRSLAGQPPQIDWDIRPTGLALTEDGTRVASCSAGTNIVQLWNLADPAAPITFQVPGEERLHCLALSPDGTVLVAGYHGKGVKGVLIWDLMTRQLRKTRLPCQDYPRQIVFSPDGRWLAWACGDGGVLLYDTAEFQRHLFVRGDNPVGVAFSPDSQLLAITSEQVGVIRLWHVASNREVAVLKQAGPPHTVMFSRQGNLLVATDRTAVRLWHLAGSGEKLVLSGHPGGVPGLAFSPDGRLLVSAGKDRTVGVWDAATGRLKKLLTGFHSAVQTVSFSPDGSLLATGDWGRSIRIWEVGSWRQLTVTEQTVGLQTWAVTFSPDGRYFAACGDGGGVLLWPIRWHKDPGRTTASLALEPPKRLSDQGALHVGFSPDSRLVAWVELPARTIHFWDVANSRHVLGPPARPLHGIQGMVFLPDGAHLAVIGLSGDPEVWNIPAKEKAFSCVTSAFDRQEEGRPSDIISLSADGKWLAQGGASVRIWDLDARKLLLALPKERSLPWSFAWSPNKERLAIGSSDGGLVIWDFPAIRAQLGKIGLWQ